MDSTFIYPVTIHRGAATGSTTAQWVASLPANMSNSDERVAVLYSSEGVFAQGLYLKESNSRTWRYLIPYDAICLGIIDGSSVDVYYAVTNSDSGLPQTAKIWRNGVETDNPTFTVNDGAVYGAMTTAAAGGGAVNSVNGVAPDITGNVAIGIPQIPGLTAALAAAGQVKTVNAATPDVNGNVTVPLASATVPGTVKGGGDIAIASDGTLSYTLPIASGSVLGGVKQGSGVTVAGDGTISANVISVNGHQGAVVVSASDITTGTLSPSVIGATPGNNDVLITNGSGVPTWVSTIPTSNLPASILGAVNYQGAFTPGTTTLPAAATGNKGWYFVASAAGTYTPPSGTLLTFSAGDWLISDGATWETVATQGAVTSVNGLTGAVLIEAHDNNSASGVSLIQSNGSTDGIIKLSRIVAGTGITTAFDGNTNLVVNATPYALPVATASVLGGVKQGSGITIAADGTISAAGGSSGVSSFNTRTGAVTLVAADVTSAGGALLDSPALTGTPTSITPSQGDYSNNIATTQFVGDAVDGALGAYAPINSPSFSGTPTSPTPGAGDNSTNIATTAFVTEAIANGAASTVQVYEYTATEGQTSFPASFNAGAVVEVFLNGVLLQSSNYNLNTVGPVVLNVGAEASDEVKIIATTPYAVADTVPVSGGTYAGLVMGVTPTAGDNSTAFATTAFVDNAISGISAGVSSFNTRTGVVTLTAADVTGVGGALLASPALTGSPTAPTATAGTNTTQIATTEFVTSAVAAGTAGVSSFNTRTGVVTLTAADVTGVGGALLASPAFTGTPVAPTATAGTNTTQLATTAFVTAAVAGVSGVASFNGRTGVVTLSGSDLTTAGGALLASPTFTGTPAAPTATAGTNTTQLATTAFVTGAVSTGVSGLAPVASPTFTGVPAAPTATAGTNTTQVATTAFVQAAVGSSVVSFNGRTGVVTLSAADVTGVGGALLASPTFTGVPAAPTATAGTSTTQIATTAFVATSYAPLASPALTGTPTAPTATAGTNTTQVATTAFVTAAVASGTAGVTSFNTRTGVVTLAAADVTGVGGALLASPTFTGTPAAPTATAGTNTTQIATTAFVGTALGSYAPLASPTLTGTPLAPTAAVGTNTTQIADTAFVYAATQGTSTVAVTNANVTLSAAQYSVPVVVVSGTLTANVTLTFPTAGQWNVVNTTTGLFNVTLSNGSGATVVAQQGAASDFVSSGSSGMLPVQANTVVGRLQSDASSGTFVSLASAATQTLNLNTATEWAMTITANTTLVFNSTLTSTQTEVFYIRFTNAGLFNITWPTGTQFAAKTAPVFTAAGGVDLVAVQYDQASSAYVVFVIGLNIG